MGHTTPGAGGPLATPGHGVGPPGLPDALCKLDGEGVGKPQEEGGDADISKYSPRL